MLFYIISRLIIGRRCAALPGDLDGGIAGRRTHDLTDDVLDAFDSKVLWEEYSLDADIIVSPPQLYSIASTYFRANSPLPLIFLGLISTKCCRPIFYTR